MDKHTPGPWQVGGQFPDATFVNAGRECVAKCDHGDNGLPHGANARLIAAAPDMLAILDELEGSFDQQTYTEKAREDFDAPDDREYSVNITAKQLRAISAAIAKATASRSDRG